LELWDEKRKRVSPKTRGERGRGEERVETVFERRVRTEA